jgi:serine/threonine protein phosphatase PrpC
MILNTSLERQHTKKMPRSKASRHFRHTHRSYYYQALANAPFVYSHCTRANERHPERNEDRVLLDTHTGLVAVFDGVGGSAGGEIASQTAARATLAGWKQFFNRSDRYHEPPFAVSRRPAHDLCNILKHLILEADELVRTEGARRAGTDDLATTVALGAFCRGDQAQAYTFVYAHVGDSRVYIQRKGGKLQRLTDDDGLLSKLVENQLVNDADAQRIDQATDADHLSDVEYSYFRLRGGITQALGGPTPPTIHINQTDVYPGDRILLCTDGIHDNLIDQEIEDILCKSPRSITARVLVTESMMRSKQEHGTTIRAKPDDMSAIVITCRF